MTPDQFHQWRKALSLTQAEAAGQLGVSKRSVSTYEATGPIPNVVGLACRALYDEFQEPDFVKLVQEQYNKLGDFVLVLPLIAKREAGYEGTIKIDLSSEVSEWIEVNAPNARFLMCTVITPDLRRRQVAVMVFESLDEMTYFKLRWN